MSKLSQQLDNDYLQAAKKKEQERMATLRLLRSALKNEQIAKKSELTDEDVIKVFKREVKRRQEAIEAFIEGQRADLKAREEAELKIIKEYLPAELSDQESKALVEKVLKENELTEQKDFGQAMKLVMAEVQGQADGKRVSQILKELLSPPIYKDE